MCWFAAPLGSVWGSVVPPRPPNGPRYSNLRLPNHQHAHRPSRHQASVMRNSSAASAMKPVNIGVRLTPRVM